MEDAVSSILFMLAVESSNEAQSQATTAEDINIKVNITNKDDQTPPILAVEKGNKRIVKPLLVGREVEVNSKDIRSTYVEVSIIYHS